MRAQDIQDARREAQLLTEAAGEMESTVKQLAAALEEAWEEVAELKGKPEEASARIEELETREP